MVPRSKKRCCRFAITVGAFDDLQVVLLKQKGQA